MKEIPGNDAGGRPSAAESRRLLAALAGTYAGRTLLVVSCGPSAALWRGVLSRLGGDAVIACVKQAIFLCRRRAAIHFFNPYNAQRYWPHNRRALRVDVRDHFAPRTFNASDLAFTLDPTTTGDLARSVASTGRFEDHTMARTGLVRPWGPGIMYDVVFYLASHLGFRSVHTVGWDAVALPVSTSDGPRPLSHFYDRPGRPVAPVQTFEWIGREPRAYRRSTLARHLLGALYNRVPKADVQGEVAAIVRSLPRLFDWLASEGMSLTIHSRLESNPIDPSIRPHVVDWSGRA